MPSVKRDAHQPHVLPALVWQCTKCRGVGGTRGPIHGECVQGSTASGFCLRCGGVETFSCVLHAQETTKKKKRGRKQATNAQVEKRLNATAQSKGVSVAKSKRSKRRNLRVHLRVSQLAGKPTRTWQLGLEEIPNDAPDLPL